MNMSKPKRPRIGKRKNKNIDYSDIPELDNDFFKRAKIVVPKNKKPVSFLKPTQTLSNKN